ncbi:hypothetical protein NDU88_003774 [Pleurodeles waltl]|uniref:Uncharacterized protein n=1 Tax=Pleurodeles waltl TaxID=8319 RepID=A0AAV7WQ12_PLEWA|nr:hypothetical protein NDU88_003774 [Pleurodeles waltl]
MQSRSQEAPGPAPRAGGRFVTSRRPHQTFRFAPPPSGWARIRIWRWAQRASQSGIAAAIWQRFRGSRSVPGRTSPLEAAPEVAATLERPRPYQPLTFTAAPKRGASQSLGSQLQGRDRTSAVPPRPQRSSHSSLSARPPALARPGTNLKSAPPEPNS